MDTDKKFNITLNYYELQVIQDLVNDHLNFLEEEGDAVSECDTVREQYESVKDLRKILWEAGK